MRRTSGRIEPLALVPLAAFVLLPPILMFGPSLVRQVRGPPEPLSLVRDSVPKLRIANEPTRGMQVSAKGFGTVLTAPAIQAAMTEERAAPMPERIAPDVTGFLRSWPEIVLNPAADQSIPRVCAFEGGERRGRILLRDGCLRFQPAGGGRETALLIASGTLFRDDGEYLAIGSPTGPERFRARVGEDDVVVRIGSCTYPDVVPPPPAHRRFCGGDALTVALSVERRPVCSRAFLDERARIESEESAIAARVKQEADACHAAGRNACPPGVIPRLPPLTDASAPCRLPTA